MSQPSEAACQHLLRQSPVQSDNRDHLKDLLRVASGGIVFTTIQKFLPEEKGTSYPLLSDRRNIVVRVAALGVSALVAVLTAARIGEDAKKVGGTAKYVPCVV